MKKYFVVMCLILLIASSALAVDFSPTIMKISGQDQLTYGFDGTTLEIPITFTGIGGTGIYCILTKGLGDEIGTVHNGFLGWHYVNGIDTCLYVSDPIVCQLGSNTLEWDGKDADGTAAPAGEYTYYAWFYDNYNVRQLASPIDFQGWGGTSIIFQRDENGNPLENPVIHGPGHKCRADDIAEISLDPREKWIIGNDPQDTSLIETTGVWGWAQQANTELLPSDHTMFFAVTQRPNAIIQMGKYKWVPNGEAELQTDWGENGYCLYSAPSFNSEYRSGHTIVPGAPDIVATNSNYFETTGKTEIVYISVEEGTLTTEVDLSGWWIHPDDGEAGGQTDGGPAKLHGSDNGSIQLGYHGACLQHIIDPYRTGEAGGDIDDLTLWANTNGDYISDRNFAEDSERPWTCFDYQPPPFSMSPDLDAAGFLIDNSYDLGAVSFALMAPDGTGIGYFAFAAEVAGWKVGHIFVENNSAYDGIYTNKMEAEEFGGGFWFVAQDVFKGTITGEPIAVDEVPDAFSVAQNSPNPFNPTTTIRFTIAEAGNVTIDVFNVAGQKVDMIASEFLSAGGHSVTWNASEFSAGVYFYTVKSGDFSKTMKMTLLN